MPTTSPMRMASRGPTSRPSAPREKAPRQLQATILSARKASASNPSLPFPTTFMFNPFYGRFVSNTTREDGMGMVTPFDAQLVTIKEDMTTKFMLSLSDQEAEYIKLEQEIRSLPDTVIFFLKRLECIEFRLHDQNSHSRIITITKSQVHPKMKAISRTEKQEFEDGNTSFKEKKSHYYHFTHTIQDMPKDNQRVNQSSAKVELAFPISLHNGPQVSEECQHIYAYLPISPRIPQLQFLIQSNFNTSASRESIDCSPWNQRLRRGVEDAFSNAVSEFAADHALRHSWMEYIPGKGMQHLWEGLYEWVIATLGERLILQTRQGRRFKTPRELRILSDRDFHKDEPISPDLPEEQYLAPEYDSFKPVLSDLGVLPLTSSETLGRLEADLLNLNSRTKYRQADDPWRLSNSEKQRVMNMEIIPLNDGKSWTKANTIISNDTAIYFPYTKDVAIPSGLSLRLAERNAAENPKRAELFRCLGVKDCPPDVVLQEISDLHRNSKQVLLEDIPSHYRYLFRKHPSPHDLKFHLRVPVTPAVHCSPQTPLYFKSSSEYHSQKLLPESYITKFNEDAAFLDESIASDLTMENFLSPTGLTWKGWIAQITGARYFPPLLQRPDKGKLSSTLLAVLKHSPHKFIGLLQAHWYSEYRSSFATPKAGSMLVALKVPCETGAMLPLNATCLPTPKLRAQAKLLGIEDSLHFLRMPEDLEDSNYENWSFLQKLGVCCTPGLRFYKAALARMVDRVDLDLNTVAQVYLGMVDTAQQKDEPELRKFFKENRAIYCPTNVPEQSCWKSPNECIWRGPGFLSAQKPLQQLYAKSPESTRFFSGILKIPDATVAYVLQKLKFQSQSGDTPFKVEQAAEIYCFLEVQGNVEVAWDLIRRDFLDKKLIFANGNWHTLSACLWESKFHLSGYHLLHHIYPELERFFVKHLKVKIGSPLLLIENFQRIAEKGHPNKNEIGRTLKQIGRIFLEPDLDETSLRALDKLKRVPFLPLADVDGKSKLVGINDEFAIPDHPRYAKAFEGHLVLLDFEVADVPALDSLFKHFGLTGRYLSTMVNETSTVSQDFTEDELRGDHLRRRAYALYCCAAKFKSKMTLRDDTQLFDQLSHLRVFTTDTFSTQLTLQFQGKPIEIPSDKIIRVHHEIQEDGQLNLYVPRTQQEWRKCYENQLPDLIGNIIDAPDAAHRIAMILNSKSQELDDLLTECDIPQVSWIPKPTFDYETANDIDTPRTDFCPNMNIDNRLNHARRSDQAQQYVAPSPPSNKLYAQFLDKVIKYTQRKTETDPFDMSGIRDVVMFETARLRNFQLEEYHSRNRKQSADIVYLDQDGSLMLHLRNLCTGGFPQFPHHEAGNSPPIEYFIEVKTTTGRSSKTFFIGHGQYELMEKYQTRPEKRPEKIYVLIRVFNLTSGDIGMKIFVDPWRFRGNILQFQHDKWEVNIE
ncbi:uncharacterized protein BDR25DRAFT_320119 [Lindgomyces ingoldianus]|uniref:Uncharacterized protein n=1 Tax=Lindgomyces ingoldianus TaxID=673940 RepID=A0ACB6Q9R0_9PLEO|nr:uncharacterized protein BDR25DRAFT_320119 [Lindgomyces ingoldianus]KAF2463270.1 hypothetical protein BDR25DRAFT_320119 [Lindgomyces ingoldianus]